MIVDHYGCPALGHPFGGCRADTSACPGNENYLAAQGPKSFLFHYCPTGGFLDRYSVFRCPLFEFGGVFLKGEELNADERTVIAFKDQSDPSGLAIEGLKGPAGQPPELLSR